MKLHEVDEIIVELRALEKNFIRLNSFIRGETYANNSIVSQELLAEIKDKANLEFDLPFMFLKAYEVIGHEIERIQNIVDEIDVDLGGYGC